jgi:hypothetical protein
MLTQLPGLLTLLVATQKHTLIKGIRIRQRTALSVKKWGWGGDKIRVSGVMFFTQMRSDVLVVVSVKVTVMCDVTLCKQLRSYKHILGTLRRTQLAPLNAGVYVPD